MQVNANQLGATRPYLVSDYARIQNPQPVAAGIDDHAVHGNQLVGGIVGISVTIDFSLRV